MENVSPCENRKEVRYSVFMKVIANGISQFPGCMEEISKSGCKIKFSDAGEIDFESEYTVTVYPHQDVQSKSFDLILIPRWVYRVDTGAVIGFSVLCTPGYSSFIKHVEALKEEETNIEI